jgi:hypothetical protein
MQNINVRRYENPEAVGGWAGWIEPDDRSWIAFIKTNGSAVFFLERDPETGAVLSREHGALVAPQEEAGSTPAGY